MADLKIDFSNCEVNIEKMFDIHDNKNVNVFTSGVSGGRGSKEEISFDQLPDILRSPKAKELWQILYREGFVNAQCITTRSYTESSIMAKEMADKLSLKEFWKEYSELWKIKNLKSYYGKSHDNQNGWDFEKKIRSLLS